MWRSPGKPATNAREGFDCPVCSTITSRAVSTHQWIETMLPQLNRRIEVLRDIRRDLWEADRSLPYIWDPVDEI
ncbi:hypothetical protein ABZ442_24920 [Streptomyces triculaminicus]|uniref:hypothetical protein n=1 Tax=Streptomyces triculaminicus TaxID=2816232 RepID=UPI0033E94D5D